MVCYSILPSAPPFLQHSPLPSPWLLSVPCPPPFSTVALDNIVEIGGALLLRPTTFSKMKGIMQLKPPMMCGVKKPSVVESSNGCLGTRRMKKLIMVETMIPPHMVTMTIGIVASAGPLRLLLLRAQQALLSARRRLRNLFRKLLLLARRSVLGDLPLTIQAADPIRLLPLLPKQRMRPHRLHHWLFLTVLPHPKKKSR